MWRQNFPPAGKIVFMSSVHQEIRWAGHANYTASKGGVMQLMRSVAQEVAPIAVRANAVAPGAIRTPINHPAWETPEAYRDLMTLCPINASVNLRTLLGLSRIWLITSPAPPYSSMAA